MSNTGKDKIFAYDNKVHHESSGGCVFFNDPSEGLLVALIKKTDGSYGIPKGHLVEGESPEEAASREMVEELSLESAPRLIKKIGVESYSFSLPDDNRKHFKDVHIFIFEVDKKESLSTDKLDKNEIGRFEMPEWVPVDEAINKLKFDSRALLRSKDEFIIYLKSKK